jgi:dihydrofolate reductase
MRVSLIVAADLSGVIGRDGGLPWHLPADLKRFKALTMGHHLVVGRKTYESIGRPLPGRTMLVVSRQPGYSSTGVTVVGSPEEAIRVAQAVGESELFVAGGAELYRHLLPRADRVYLTRVEARVEGDTHFPDLDPARFRLASVEPRPADAKNPLPLRFEVWERP